MQTLAPPNSNTTLLHSSFAVVLASLLLRCFAHLLERVKSYHNGDSSKGVAPVFLSHTGQDVDAAGRHYAAEFAALVHKFLRPYNVDAFFDDDSIRGGDVWRDTIRRNVRGCSVFVAILSPQYWHRFWCMEELDIAIREGKQILPVFLGCEPPVHGSVHQELDMAFRNQLRHSHHKLADEKFSRFCDNIVQLDRWQGKRKFQDGKAPGAKLVKSVVEDIRRLAAVSPQPGNGQQRNNRGRVPINASTGAAQQVKGSGPTSLQVTEVRPTPPQPNASNLQTPPIFDPNFMYQPSHPLVEALEGVSSIAESVVSGLIDLWLAAENPGGPATIARAGGIAAILTAMEAHAKDATVQEYACWALGNLACNDENQVGIAQAGGIAAILTAMETHAKVATVQEYACWALGNLACNDDNKVAIAQARGIAAILVAMNSHVEVATVQQSACRALYHLACNDENKVAIAQARGIAAILTAMEAHADVVTVKNTACWALRALAFNNPRNTAEIVGSGGKRYLKQ